MLLLWNGITHGIALSGGRFAGLLGNAEIANSLQRYQPCFDNFAITMSGRVDLRRLAEEQDCHTPISANLIGAVKFQKCLPPRVLAAMHAERLSDQDAAAFIRRAPVLWREFA
jgi:hypothetical protein